MDERGACDFDLASTLEDFVSLEDFDWFDQVEDGRYDSPNISAAESSFPSALSVSSTQPSVGPSRLGAIGGEHGAGIGPGLCWGGELKSLGTMRQTPCVPGFQPGKGHLKNKFCRACREFGISLPSAQVCALTPSLTAAFSNGTGGGLWSRASDDYGGIKYRLINHTKTCSGPCVVIFRTPPPLAWAPMPEAWLAGCESGAVRLLIACGTLVPSGAVTRPHGVQFVPHRKLKMSRDVTPMPALSEPMGANGLGAPFAGCGTPIPAVSWPFAVAVPTPIDASYQQYSRMAIPLVDSTLSGICSVQACGSGDPAASAAGRCDVAAQAHDGVPSSASLQTGDSMAVVKRETAHRSADRSSCGSSTTGVGGVGTFRLPSAHQAGVVAAMSMATREAPPSSSAPFAVFMPSALSVFGASAFSSGLYAGARRASELSRGQESTPLKEQGNASGDSSEDKDAPSHESAIATSREGSFKRTASSDGQSSVVGEAHKMHRAELPQAPGAPSSHSAATTSSLLSEHAVLEQVLPLIASTPFSMPTGPPTSASRATRAPTHLPNDPTPPSPPSSPPYHRSPPCRHSPPCRRVEVGCASRTTPKTSAASASLIARMHPLTLQFVAAPFEARFREAHFSDNLDFIVGALAVFISMQFAQLLSEPSMGCLDDVGLVVHITIITSQAACLALAIWLRRGSARGAGYRYFDVAYSLAFACPCAILVVDKLIVSTPSALSEACPQSSYDGVIAAAWSIAIVFMRYLCIDMRLQVGALSVAIYCRYLLRNMFSDGGELELRRAIAFGMCGGYLLEWSIREMHAKRSAAMAPATVEAAMEAGMPPTAREPMAHPAAGEAETLASHCQVKQGAAAPLDLVARLTQAAPGLSLLPRCMLQFHCAATEQRARAYAFTEAYRYEIYMHVLCLAYGVWLRYVEQRSTLCAWLPEMAVHVLWLATRLCVRRQGDTPYGHKLHDVSLTLGMLTVACVEMFYRPQLSEEGTLPRFLLLPLVLLRAERAYSAYIHLVLVAMLMCLSTMSPGWSVYGQPYDSRQLCQALLLATASGYGVDRKMRNAFIDFIKCEAKQCPKHWQARTPSECT